ncbi:TAXI family TRAP transporter solute-binding subunit [Ruminobacter sp.]|uniref:TAXI family TRAP transporter solute-binding subunit n=1 Tax=Ruminobacter sp. TaxID=2774296 RepID=UPI00386D72A6
MKKLLTFIFSAVICPLAITGCGEKELSIGTAFNPSMYHSFGEQMKKNMENAKGLKYSVTVLPTAGSVENVRMINDNRLQLALIQNDVSYEAYHSTGSFKGEQPLRNFVAVAGLYTEACHIVVRADSSIHKVSDLLGKAISLGTFNSGTEKNAKEILNKYDISGYSIVAKHMNINEAMNALDDGSIDALFLTNGLRSMDIYGLSGRIKIRLLSIDEEQLQSIVNNSPFFIKTVIPANTYVGQTEDIQTIGIKTILAVNRSMQNDEVYGITENLFENAREFDRIVPTNYNLTIKDSAKGISIPFHPGAAKYYRSKGEKVRTE